MKLFQKTLLFFSVLLLLSNEVLAQGGPIDPPACWPPPCIPITDHIGWLIAALIGFGILKAYQYSRKSVVRS